MKKVVVVVSSLTRCNDNVLKEVRVKNKYGCLKESCVEYYISFLTKTQNRVRSLFIRNRYLRTKKKSSYLKVCKVIFYVRVNSYEKYKLVIIVLHIIYVYTHTYIYILVDI